jgi:hypothetical protein
VQAFKRALQSEDHALALMAAEALMASVLGEPKETVEQPEMPADIQAIRDMDSEEREDLYRRLLAAEGIEIDE